jgi:hypothetical protein
LRRLLPLADLPRPIATENAKIASALSLSHHIIGRYSRDASAATA